MKKLIIGSSIAIFIFISLLISALLYYESTLWDEMSSKISPDGKWSITHYDYKTDTDRHAPYGNYLILRNTYLISRMTTGEHVIFGGYCPNSLEYEWISEKHIKITCTENDLPEIRTLSNQAYGIKIDYHHEPNS